MSINDILKKIKCRRKYVVQNGTGYISIFCCAKDNPTTLNLLVWSRLEKAGAKVLQSYVVKTGANSCTSHTAFQNLNAPDAFHFGK